LTMAEKRRRIGTGSSQNAGNQNRRKDRSHVSSLLAPINSCFENTGLTRPTAGDNLCLIQLGRVNILVSRHRNTLPTHQSPPKFSKTKPTG
jgi:hypothetical protein